MQTNMPGITRKQKEEQQHEAAIEAERAINDEVRKFDLEFAELSNIMRELLGKVYIRGGFEALKKIKAANVQDTNENIKS